MAFRLVAPGPRDQTRRAVLYNLLQNAVVFRRDDVSQGVTRGACNCLRSAAVR